MKEEESEYQKGKGITSSPAPNSNLAFQTRFGLSGGGGSHGEENLGGLEGENAQKYNHPVKLSQEGGVQDGGMLLPQNRVRVSSMRGGICARASLGGVHLTPLLLRAPGKIKTLTTNRYLGGRWNGNAGCTKAKRGGRNQTASPLTKGTKQMRKAKAETTYQRSGGAKGGKFHRRRAAPKNCIRERKL